MPCAAPGITPAHAGKSDSELFSSPEKRDHPRTRGEKLSAPTFPALETGSPPHTRGKGSMSVINAWVDRITPAHAGKSNYVYYCQNKGRDHPRTRGEKREGSRKTFPLGGSPPHTRGKGFCAISFYGITRITPAHAGKSPSPDC